MPLWQWAQVQEVLLELDEGARALRCVSFDIAHLALPDNFRGVIKISSTLEAYHRTREIAGS